MIDTLSPPSSSSSFFFVTKESNTRVSLGADAPMAGCESDAKGLDRSHWVTVVQDELALSRFAELHQTLVGY